MAALSGTYFYKPAEEGCEAQVVDRLARWRAAQEKALGLSETTTLPELSEAEISAIKRKLTGRSG